MLAVSVEDGVIGLKLRKGPYDMFVFKNFLDELLIELIENRKI